MIIKTKYSNDRKRKVNMKISENGKYYIVDHRKRFKLGWKIIKYYKFSNKSKADRVYKNIRC